MTALLDRARRLIEGRPSHPVVSLYMDLDPERFATPPARASQVRSLIDEAAREVEGDSALSHEERIALRDDLERVGSYLQDRQPYAGARALAIFCSGRDGLFEEFRLPRPTEGRVVIDKTPYVEPLVAVADERRWCVALVSRRSARIFSGSADDLVEQDRIEDEVHGQHDQGGWSQANYQRSVEKDADDHLRRVADALRKRFAREKFDRLALGGPREVVARLETLMHEELRSLLAPERDDVDISSATDEQVRSAIAPVLEVDAKQLERAALDRFAAGVGAGGRAAAGIADTLEALNQRRVEALLLEGGFDRPGARCPQCELLTLEEPQSCPADGTALERIEHLREATIESALKQDADVLLIRDYPDLAPHGGIGALLRY